MSTETREVDALIPGVDQPSITVSVYLPVLVVAHDDDEQPFALAAFRNAIEAQEFMERVEAGEIESPDFEPTDGHLELRHVVGESR